MKRILHVMQPRDGGVPQLVTNVSGELSARGWEVEVAASEAAGPGSPQRARLEAAGARVHALPMTGLIGAGDARAAARLRELDSERRYDVIHAHSSKAGALVRAALPRPERIVYTPHCFAFLAGFGAARAVYWAAEQALLPRTGAVVACSRWEAAKSRRSLLGAHRKLRVVQNGVPACERVEPDPRITALPRPIIGFLTRLDPPKEPVRLIEAAALERFPGTVVIVGSGQFEGEVREAIAAHGLGERVLHLPFNPPVERFLHGFDMLVLPSRWESLPLAILEAMACGLPTIASDVGGMAEAIEDGVTGRLVPPEDTPALAAAIGALAQDPEGLRAMGARARERWSERFSLTRMVDELEAVYAERAAA
ncbi:glycosyltransferase [Solirubrobacter sp. CPCC 204708]|uniref:Glycosyltransferase n=1 Tax=Solirubrobacter deserti TaxID=2282478 RepID=A0ABT4RS62_9ACTN|nr:glycosyltransferase [Solirubrobacter deserti]MBE2318742.1 glycosyltransferase [Solirubrobacter deserti]MDA0141332.1 glycosyltransferase [Solirubrobacter deserti]